MAGVGFSSLLENANEQLLSSDVNRLQQLTSRELQNVFQGLGTGWAGDAINGFIGPAPSVTFNSAFTMNIGNAQAFGLAVAPPGPNDSSYLIFRWANQVLTFSVPDPVNPRIDLICATAATVQADPQSRNILIDPSTHTFAPATVNKTVNPQATLSVVTGTPAGYPLSPAVPGGNTIALFEVFVPAAAPTAATFLPVQRLFRPAPWPIAGLTGVMQGCKMYWPSTVAPSYPQFYPSSGPPTTEPSILVIDGEVINFNVGATGIAPELFSDSKTGGGFGTNTDPFGAAGPANTSSPYFVYAVGGRHSAQMSGNNASGVKVPVTLVASRTPPNPSDWHPTSTIKTPRGDLTRLGAVYVGMGFTMSASTNSQPCVMDGAWIYPLIDDFSLEVQNISAGASTDITLNCLPTNGFVHRAKLSYRVAPAAGTNGVGSGLLRTWVPASDGARIVEILFDTEGGVPHFYTGQCEAWFILSPQMTITNTRALAGDVFDVIVVGLAHRVPRFDGGASAGGF